jgi:peptide/nickel transport system substrate-binding protein
MSARYWSRGATNRVARRRFLAGSVGVMGAAALAAACGGDNKGPSSTGQTGATGQTGGTAQPSAAAAATGTPRRGGVLIDRLNAAIPTVDPHQAVSSATGISTAPLFNGLLRYDPGVPEMPPSAVQGDLAEKWEQPDPLTVLFTLRKGVKFHNGSDFTSEDVVANYEWIKSPPQGKTSAYAEPFQAVAKIEATDPNTVKITLSRPSGSFIPVIAYSAYVIHEGKLLRSQGGIQQPGIGTGPFKWKSFDAANMVEVERNPNYFLANQPYLDGIKFLVMTDQDAAKASFIAGQVHSYWVVTRSPDDLDDVKARLGNNITVYESNALAKQVIAMNSKVPPFNDVRVRKAIHSALVRTEPLQLFTQGKGTPLGYMFPGGAWAIPASELAKYAGYQPLNVNDAKSLLSAAGAENLSLSLLTVPGIYQPISELVQNQLKKIGINTTLEPLDLVTHRARLNGGQFQLANVSVSAAVDDPDAIFGHLVLPTGAENFGKISSDVVTSLYEKQTTILNANERKAVVQDLERASMELYSTPSYYNTFNAIALSTKVRGWKGNISAGLFGTGRQHADTWLAE